MSPDHTRMINEIISNALRANLTSMEMDYVAFWRKKRDAGEELQPGFVINLHKFHERVCGKETVQ